MSLCCDAFTSLWRCPRWLPLGDWSYTLLMTQSILAQNASWVAMSAKPPAESTPTSADLPSLARVTLYSGPS